MSEVKIYKASAGSGKTFTITLEYLKLIIINPFRYKNILAVTFTNKASAEMKSRIITSLYAIAKEQNTPYFDLLTNSLKLTKEQLIKKSKTALFCILHDYSRFAIGTIDSFFQKVISNFIKETGLQAGFTLELDTNKVLSQVIDNTLNDIENNENLKNWLIKFSESKIIDGKSWNIKADIEKLARELFNETLKLNEKALLEKVSDYNFMQTYLDELFKTKNEYIGKSKKISDKAFNIMSEFGLEIDDFPSKSRGFASYFNKLKTEDYIPGKTVLNAVDNIDAWHKKSDPKKETIINAFNKGLNNLLKEAVELFNSEYADYVTADCILSNIYTLGLLNEISKKIREYITNNNVFLISDSSKLLYDIIGNNDAPFIYEKLGNTFSNLMIDEFQDTSELQWNNFRPLVLNSLANGYSNLIVGDVKQSIYRWRNSNWQLLAEKIYSDLEFNNVKTESLTYNRRSKQNVIKFNNSVLQNAVEILQNHFNNILLDDNANVEIQHFYENRLKSVFTDFIQKFPENNKQSEGYIKVEFHNDDIDTNLKIAESIKTFLENGIKQSEITILVRTKTEGRSVAHSLMGMNDENFFNEKIHVISDEVLNISYSNAVNLLINCIRFINNPEESLYRHQLYYDYLFVTNTFNEETFAKNINIPDFNNFIKLLPADFEQKFDNFKSLPLYDLVENLIKVFDLYNYTSHQAYILSFLENVFIYSTTENNDSNKFIEWWDEFGNSKSIQLNKGINAINVLTIHKAKGLEFNTVILPYCNWNIDANFTQNNIIWCNTDITPFNMLDIIPLKYSKDLKYSHFNKEYYNEKFQFFMDNLNVFYVAITRAVNNLVIFCPKNKKNEISNISDLLFNSITANTIDSADIINLSALYSEEEQVFELGTIYNSKSETKAIDSMMYLQSSSDTLNFSEKINIKKTNFYNSIINNKQIIISGNTLHGLFSTLNEISNFESKVNEFVLSGLINSSDGEWLIDEMKIQRTKFPIIEEWFNPKYKTINERDILKHDGKIRRPDKLVFINDTIHCIDYKFGNEKNNHYNNQIKEYKLILKDMGYENIEGYIWYFRLGEIENV